MAERDKDHFTEIAQFLEQPRLPGVEKKFNDWIEASPDNDLEWQQWQHLADKTRRFRSEPFDIEKGWETLRDSIGLRRQKKHRSGSKDGGISRSRFVRKPVLASLAAMIALSLFFFILYLVRARIGF